MFRDLINGSSDARREEVNRFVNVATVDFLHNTALADLHSQEDQDKPHKTGKIVKEMPAMVGTDDDGLNMDEGKVMVIPEDKHEHDSEAEL